MAANVTAAQKKLLLLPGLVIGHRGKGLLIEDSQGQTILCHSRRRLEPVAAGDRVLWKAEDGNIGVVEQIEPRKSLLERPGVRDKRRPFAANIDQLFIVCAVEPEPDFLLIDQCLVMCEHNQITPHLILNKIDIAPAEQLEQLLAQFQVYQTLGYQLLQTSVDTNSGIDALQTQLKDSINIFTGQSGVGKSSLTALFMPEQQVKVGALSAANKHGRHTTTAATLYHLPNGGDLIDSPGLAVFGLAGIEQRQLAWGYREFRTLMEHCRFHNCRHLNDKGCAVTNALDKQEIEAARYHRYSKLCAKMLLET